MYGGKNEKRTRIQTVRLEIFFKKGKTYWTLNCNKDYLLFKNSAKLDIFSQWNHEDLTIDQPYIRKPSFLLRRFNKSPVCLIWRNKCCLYICLWHSGSTQAGHTGVGSKPSMGPAQFYFRSIFTFFDCFLSCSIWTEAENNLNPLGVN
jgi:hypothetical protein